MELQQVRLELHWHSPGSHCHLSRLPGSSANSRQPQSLKGLSWVWAGVGALQYTRQTSGTLRRAGRTGWHSLQYPNRKRSFAREGCHQLQTCRSQQISVCPGTFTHAHNPKET